MQRAGWVIVGLGGVALGVIVTLFSIGQPRIVVAASNDRYQDYILATGAVSINPRIQTDGVWLLDYRTGKLLGTVIDKSIGRTIGFAEVDLAAEFGIEPRQDVHFLMTTGYVTQGQSALYIAETTTGRFGVYTMGPGANGSGVAIRRHEMSSFRQPVVQPVAGNVPREPAGGLPGGMPAMVPAQQPPAPPAAPPVAPNMK